MICDRFRLLGFPGGLTVKNLPAVQETEETQVGSLGGEDPLQEGMATHSSLLAWGISWTQEPGGFRTVADWDNGLASQHANTLPLEAKTDIKMTLFPPSANSILRWFCVILKENKIKKKKKQGRVSWHQHIGLPSGLICKLIQRATFPLSDSC